MLKVFEKKLRLVRLRCSVNLLLEHTGRVLAAAGAVAVLAVLVEKLFALTVVNPWTVRIFPAAAVFSGCVLWLLNHPSRMQVSLLLDERLRLHERFSTTLALAHSEHPFASAARDEAYETARRINPQAHFPIRPSRYWAFVGGTWFAAVMLAMFMPQKDLLGFLKNRRQQQQQAQQIQTATADVNETTAIVKSTLSQLGKPELAKDLGGLNQVPEGAKPDDIKRQAIRKLSDISDELKKMQNAAQVDSMKLMQQMFKQLPGSSEAFSQELRLALAKGNFDKASSVLREMQKQLLEGKLSDEQRKALTDQLQELARQLQQLAAKNEELEKEMEKLGLDKELAKSTEQQLRQALQKQGLSGEQIEQLLQKAAVCRMASGRCSGLGQAMGACGTGAGGLSGDELGGLAEQLDQLEALQQQLMLTQAALDQIARACAGLGKGMCKGLGCQGANCPFCGGRGCNGYGPFRTGSSRGMSSGTGGPGIGYGPRATDQDGQTSTMKATVQNKDAKGPTIASWYFKGTQVKGEAQRDFSEVMQAARDNAAEAISENQIPRRYEEAVKTYFGRLEKSGNE
ncbi:MAG TPA: hypothetical protein VMX13_04340 [Sedimentisphaerales bacterium]|nr:hypothetical protein [Sedimentisphaerales bacterium]